MKLTFDEVLGACAEQRTIDRDNVLADVLRRRVWLLMYSAPGCLPDHSEVSRTRAEALESARLLYAEDAPRGFMTALRRNGIAAADSRDYYRVQVVHIRVAGLF
jgi:hypothetical protein